MLKKEQLRPFLLGAIISTGIVVISHYVGTQEGYFTCVETVVEEFRPELAETHRQNED